MTPRYRLTTEDGDSIEFDGFDEVLLWIVADLDEREDADAPELGE